MTFTTLHSAQARVSSTDGNSHHRRCLPEQEGSSASVKRQKTLPNLSILVGTHTPHNICLSKLREDARNHRDWFDLTDVIDLDSCSRDVLDAFVIGAPTDFTQGMLYGKLTFRMHEEKTGVNDFVRHDSPDSLSFIEFRKTIRSIDERLLALSENFIEWFDEFEHISADSCTRVELDDLILRAPTTLVQGMLFGKLELRIKHEAAMGRAFA